jgi:hypothetical protein
MLWLIAAAAAANAAPPPTGRTAPVVARATATVRIVSGVQLKLDSAVNEGAPAARDSKVQVNGAEQPARLIEFE